MWFLALPSLHPYTFLENVFHTCSSTNMNFCIFCNTYKSLIHLRPPLMCTSWQKILQCGSWKPYKCHLLQLAYMSCNSCPAHTATLAIGKHHFMIVDVVCTCLSIQKNYVSYSTNPTTDNISSSLGMVHSIACRLFIMMK